MSFVVGLTGGIGSGKSTVAAAFVRLGAGLVDSDALARELTAPGGAALPAIVQAFGGAMVGADGSLDRAAMRDKVFADPSARQQLEAILHPLIRARAATQVSASLAPYVLMDIPLLVESGRDRYTLDRVLVVDCPESAQIERVMARSGLSAVQVENIMRAQASRAARRAVADDVIDNSGSETALLETVAELHGRYLEMAKDKLLKKSDCR